MLEVCTYWKYFDLLNLMSIGLVIEAIAQEIPELPEGTFESIGDGFFLALELNSQRRPLKIEMRRTFSNACPLDLALSIIPKPVSSR